MYADKVEVQVVRANAWARSASKVKSEQAAMTYLREDQADIRVGIDGVSYGDGNSWATYTGST